MKLARFFEKFDQLADAPNAVAKMRELILHSAVHGNLVDQLADDEPAETLLSRSRIEMAKIMAEGKAKREKHAEPVTGNDCKFDLPPGWTWCRLVDTAQFINGVAFKPSDWGNEGRPIIRIQNLSGRNLDYNRTKAEVDNSVIVQDGDILVSWSATLDAFIWRGEEGVLNQHIFRVLPAPLADKNFLYWLLKWVIRDLAESDHAHGLVMSHINRGPFLAHPIPLPPLAEQKRIVAKVDELMALCDRLEAQQQERDTRNAALARASLARFAEAPTPANLDFLFHNAYTITPADLRKSILTLAVQGKLVPQDPNDEPASNLLTQMFEEKHRLVSERKIRQQDDAAPIADNELPFDIPEGWEWARLSSITRRIHYGYTASAKPDIQDVRLVRITDIQNNSVDWPSVPGCEISKEDIPQYKLERGDILVARTGGTVGKTYLVRDVPVVAVFASYLIRIQGATSLFDRYLKLFLESPTYWVQLEEGARGGAQPNVNGQTLGRMIVTIPPRTEQRRIVARVDQLMALVDQLETQLTASRATAEKLMKAVVAELVKSEPPVVSAPVSDQKPAQSNLASISSRRSAKKKVSDEFVEAIVITQLTRDLATSKFPLGRMRYNKLAYLAHRKAEDDVMQRYLKKAAGPYSPWSKYGGPEKIALENGYIKNAKSGNYEGWIPGERVGDIDLYLANYPICSAVSWAVAKLRYKKKEELELLATVDFAALELRTRDRDVTRETIKWIISTNKEWAPKLSRGIFSDESIDKALAELAGLFPSHYA